MGKDLKGKELGEGIVQRSNGTYQARFVDKFGKRRQKKSKKLQELRQWLADATYIDKHSDLDQAAEDFRSFQYRNHNESIRTYYGR